MDKIDEDFAGRLLQITSSCRYDMHEPDEQDISAFVVGNHLDNACGDRIEINQILGRYQEYIVIINKNGQKTELFNLATLIAYARIGCNAEAIGYRS